MVKLSWGNHAIPERVSTPRTCKIESLLGVHDTSNSEHEVEMYLER